MISLTRREFDALSSTLTQTWIEAHWSALARRGRRLSLPDPKCNQPREEPCATVRRIVRLPRPTH
jgi:hypothetical protein